MNSFSDERLTRLRNACYSDGPISPDSQAAFVAYSIKRLQASRAVADVAQELRETKDRLAEIFEAEGSHQQPGKLAGHGKEGT